MRFATIITLAFAAFFAPVLAAPSPVAGNDAVARNVCFDEVTQKRQRTQGCAAMLLEGLAWALHRAYLT
ncbi:hypothetical protein FA95DRAFT_1613133 [Auriscalpium vulgare]|uniref:Uncharacterized protein n=1 Tax=Auriscalpium vulgare TaxID=40419 RepID=A0ACB8R433_9AGAM|nr:hypothetical protein FA95DRAFT_1613133 [Auriscalpium vulgare]